MYVIQFFCMPFKKMRKHTLSLQSCEVEEQAQSNFHSVVKSYHGLRGEEKEQASQVSLELDSLHLFNVSSSH